MELIGFGEVKAVGEYDVQCESGKGCQEAHHRHTLEKPLFFKPFGILLQNRVHFPSGNQKIGIGSMVGLKNQAKLFESTCVQLVEAA